MSAMRVLVLVVAILELTFAQSLNKNSFPDDFLFGVATASYQVEGAWNDSDKSESIWDYLTHNYPELILDGSNGDVACDSFNHIDDDVALLKNLGVNFYRLSISWTRLMPNPYSTKISEAGLAYYNSLIDALVAANITPMVTLYHWDLPNDLQKLGGWLNPMIVDYYGIYTRACFENFGDRVNYWITFNEPSVFCAGYGSSSHAPVNVKQPGIGEYICAHHMLKSHARAYHIYDEEFKSTQNGYIGISLPVNWYEPNTTSPEDVAATERAMHFGVGMYAHPIFSEEGDYPEIVKTTIGNRSALEGFAFSRLPTFTDEEVQYIQGTADFFGINHYTSYIVGAAVDEPIGTPSTNKDMGVPTWRDSSWEGSASSWLYSVPWGFRKMLVWISNEYGFPIYVTENGFSDHGELDDCGRVKYYQNYLSALLDALADGANVKGYTAWSFLDNYEWLEGYVNRFGLHYVNMSDPARPRTIKRSGEFIKDVIATRKVTLDDTSFCET